ncbi:hypothetical protein AMET1_0521 [Methanonatronarchaeum thermophilum]|uniref:Uncharacterized protein n=1 Tax=Methanonatronarchaeum thermophilum TaxID=1927129 RepID=A0A1Y3GCA9_9EURY|nr:hypothetical protein [Methanonatronarchaeum thermophilum]OUJ18870.1 hypothetical protein AMET1_0521 [Methanonatronarchaeum thermophilum]
MPNKKFKSEEKKVINEIEEFSFNKEGNRLLKYSIESLLEEIDPERKGYVSTTRFFKLIFLVHKKLQEKNINIGLPYFWYLYGPVCIEKKLPEGDYVKRKGSYLPTKHKKEPSKKVEKKIQRTIEKISHDYKGTKTDEIVDNVYQKYAPYEFQLNFRKFRGILNVKEMDVAMEFAGKENRNKILIEKLDQMLHSFPEEDFREIYNQFLQWENVMRYLADKGFNTEEKKFMKDFSDKFWELFCKLLRIKKYSKIDKYIIKKWKNSFKQKDFEEYKFDIQKFKNKFYTEMYKPRNEFKSERKTYKKTVYEEFINP